MSGAAAEWAERAGPLDVRDRPQLLDRRVVQAVPAYEAAVDRILAGLGVRVRAARAERLAALAAEDPAAALVVDRPLWRMVAAIVGTLAAAGAFALYFSRADFTAGAILPLAVGFLAVALLATGGGVLPLRRSNPPASGSLFLAWAAALLGGATAAGATASGGGAAGAGLVALWALAGALCLLALGAQLAHSTEPSAARRARADRVAAYRADLRAEADAAIADAAAAVASAHDALGEQERQWLAGEQAEAHAVLERRGLLPAGAAVPTPGLVLADRTAAALAASIGVRDAARLLADPTA
ncbi:hypothetical protein [Agromyces archimandritae]|uniref:Uncharacterized protein n=1 Tax=Agromyces archimandritae TaxID=2781962 RepID=A0A975FP30_9MICO|nr:hypothetical protein [Agromyces archimandritae]QTX05501.1 hypothetical protein G127AT_04600 [Agromyces archimandritae]